MTEPALLDGSFLIDLERETGGRRNRKVPLMRPVPSRQYNGPGQNRPVAIWLLLRAQKPRLFPPLHLEE
jgi:hypothetical protein